MRGIENEVALLDNLNPENGILITHIQISLRNSLSLNLGVIR